MKNRILAAAASAVLLATSASAAPAQRCDRDGCWTYDCDATSNHCHRHWISTSQTTPTGYQPGTDKGQNPGDQVCDGNGENCKAVVAAPR
jgi:hypothetical protein